jgi:hypothetical protein
MKNQVEIISGVFSGDPVQVPPMTVAGVPEGFALVPIVPTLEMYEAAERNATRVAVEARRRGSDDTEPGYCSTYRAMLGAAPSPITDAPVTQPEAEKADAVDAKSRPFGCALAMGVLQSDLYRQLDDVQRAECDELVRRNLEWFKADAAIATLEKPHAE